MIQYAGLWFPNDGTLTKALRARLDSEAVYRGDRLAEALAMVEDRRWAVDCGANVGMWTRELAKHFEKVVAIEPSLANLECLRVNTDHLGNVIAVGAALGEKSGRCGLASGKGAFGSSVVPDGDVTMMRLDELNLERVDYIKVHVNGYELAALKGAKATLVSSQPALTVVLKPKLAAYDTAPEDVIAWLAGQGYRLAGGQKPYRIFVPGE